MAKILLINPNKWGRGITPIWIASHTACLKKDGHEVELFDATFYENWTFNETSYNTNNKQYSPTDYLNVISFSKNNIIDDFLKKCNSFKPDIIFWSAISSHIHGEGEYVNIQYGYEIAKNFVDPNTIILTGGLQATAVPKKIFKLMSEIDYLIRGESDLVLTEIANNIKNIENIQKTKGLCFKKSNKIIINPPQKIIKDMDIIPNYDYSVFDSQVFLRPYNGRILKAIDYELSRGCVYACEYCVETVIQKYYGFEEVSSRGTILSAKDYLRNKSALRVFNEMKDLNNKYDIELFRCQDTNFLSINRKMLIKLSNLISESNLNIMLYIETRPEGINSSAIELLKKLKVDGVGMGIELSSQEFREDKLRRFADTDKTIKAFALLKDAGIRRTSYNIIGLPEQDEQSIIETIDYNRLLNPDNITVAFYSPYIGTAQQIKASEEEYFDDYEHDVDGQLRTVSKHVLIKSERLNYYKKNFISLARSKNNN